MRQFRGQSSGISGSIRLDRELELAVLKRIRCPSGISDLWSKHPEIHDCLFHMLPFWDLGFALYEILSCIQSLARHSKELCNFTQCNDGIQGEIALCEIARP